MYLVHSQLRAAGEVDLHWNVTRQESELEQASYNPPGRHALALVPYISTYFPEGSATFSISSWRPKVQTNEPAGDILHSNHSGRE